MTAEIAVLNKSAVALATDSAVTISAGNQAVKIFESADKLFELSNHQPLGIMIYNGMQFLGVPLETILKGFRSRNGHFNKVEDAANAVLSHLYELVDEAPDTEIENAIQAIVRPIVSEISSELGKRLLSVLEPGKALPEKEQLNETIRLAHEEVLDRYDAIVLEKPDAQFIPRIDGNKNRKKDAPKYRKMIRQTVLDGVSGLASPYVNRIVTICTNIMKSDYLSPSKTGLVIAGFGESERFPTLISYEIDGLHEGKIRCRKTEHCDIDRRGIRAFVRPFAQKDMVDRFLHGLDDGLRSDITRYCRETIGKISDGIFESIVFSDDAQRSELVERTRQAEATFTKNLNEQAFDAFQTKSRREIEDMVEFMPKPELAKMAEALIDLTSIKRKVSQGMETVGGPVDVAVISKNDGFVWVKRKHYFPAEINSRYFSRNTTRAKIDHDGSE